MHELVSLLVEYRAIFVKDFESKDSVARVKRDMHWVAVKMLGLGKTKIWKAERAFRIIDRIINLRS